MPLIVLYGSLFNYDQSKIQRKIVIKEIKSSSISLIGDTSKKTMCILRITYPSEYSYHESLEDSSHQSEAYLSDVDDEGEETSIDQLSDEINMLVHPFHSLIDSEKIEVFDSVRGVYATPT
ncbi:hypothetical protein L6452_40754 [Arctium lappa]|uniref:Uncharacterized protein n=1 Tax=Arctium lappa TaxID=4217 RepID=A0ACB8XM87_ARCLA|nr:hypothetical protein L6452_40754 [Arctium lappa]